MFGWLNKDPHKQIQRQYEAKLQEARDVQRNGNIVRYAELTAEAEELLLQLTALEASEAEQRNQA